MTQSAAQAIRAWRYPAPYDFYDLDADADDLAEFMDQRNWPGTYFTAHDPEGDLIGFFICDRQGTSATVGVGLRPDLTGIGLGTLFVASVLDYGARDLGIEDYSLEVAAFNERAITVYRRLRFRTDEEFVQQTNGGEYRFLRMRGPAVRGGACIVMADGDRRVALQLRDNKPHVGSADCWGLFGGMMKDHETATETILREMREELEIELDVERLSFAKQITTPLRLRSHVFLYVLEDEMWRAKLHEGQRFALVGADDIENGMLQGKTVIPHQLGILQEYWSGQLKPEGRG